MLSFIPPDLQEVVLLALMNPGTILAGYLLGKRASEPQKIIVGAFASGVAGVAFAILLMVVGLTTPKTNLLTGVFIAAMLLGVFWTWLGYKVGHAKRSA